MRVPELANERPEVGQEAGGKRVEYCSWCGEEDDGAHEACGFALTDLWQREGRDMFLGPEQPEPRIVVAS